MWRRKAASTYPPSRFESPGVSDARAWYTDLLGLVSKSIQGGPWRYGVWGLIDEHPTHSF